MPPPRKTHLEALIEKAPVESKGFFFFTPQQLRPLGDSRPVSGATAGNAVTTTANGNAMSQPMSEQFKLIRETGDISGFRLGYGSRPNDPVPFVLTLTPRYVAQALGKTPPVTYLEITKYLHDNAGDLRAKAAFEKGRGRTTLTL